MQLRNIPRRFARGFAVLTGRPPSSSATEESYVPIDPWVSSHYMDVVNEFAAFVAGRHDLTGKSLLDVGSGDCLIDYGLLNLPLARVTGLDIVAASEKDLAGLPARIQAAGLTPPEDISRFDHFDYDGTNMPFESGSFDIVFSWSAFEHVAEVDEVLKEIRRVMKDEGFAFIQVFPWFASRHGSHLTDHVSEPFFHLREDHAATRMRVEAASESKPDQRDFMLGHLWTEFTYLNKISADDFYSAAKKAGFKADKVRLISHEDDLSGAPDGYSLSELMVAGTMMLLTKD